MLANASLAGSREVVDENGSKIQCVTQVKKAVAGFLKTSHPRQLKPRGLFRIVIYSFNATPSLEAIR